MALGMVLIPMGDGIAKHVQTISPYAPEFISWSRFGLGALFVLPYALYSRQLPPPSRKHSIFWSRQIVRGVLIASTVTLIIKAVGLSPLANVFGAFFIGPGVSVILAQLILGARATRGDWLAVVLGFMGVLMVVQPTGNIGPGIPWALAAGACYGAFLVATRWAAGSGAPIAQLGAQFGVAAVCLTPFGLPELLNHGIQVPAWILLSSLLSATANLLSIIALAQVGNAKLAPVVYLQVVSATLIGVFAFSDTPNRWTAFGLCLIVLTGIVQAAFNHSRDKISLK